jgi:putative PIN family toxin of toxin-antitoxin system
MVSKPTRMTRVFLDANVLFSAAYSATGASREILRRALRHEIDIVVSRYVLKETRRNLEHKAPQAVDAFKELISLLSVEMEADPSPSKLQAAASYINLKDAPIIAAAVNAEADYLVTLDRRHFIADPAVAQRSGLSIVTPDQLVAILRGQR